jgi:DNA processing protein
MDPHLLVAAAEGFAPGLIAALLDPNADLERLLADPPFHLPPAVRARLSQRDALERTAAAWLEQAARLHLHVITPAQPNYPERMRRAPLRPLVLFVRGDVALLQDHAARGLTIVGSRTPTAYGVAATTDFATACARAGLVVWSGLALGVDGVAHESALAVKAPTVAVLAGGLSAVYPRAHQDLADRIVAGGGLWVAEAPPALRAGRGHFPRRNRILATATAVVLVTEAGMASGSLHTAWFAAEAGTTVFAVPGTYTSPRSRGCHQLITEGAQLARDPEDLLRCLEVTPALADARGATAACSADELAILRVVDAGPQPEDLVYRETRLPREKFTAALFALTERGLVQVLAGGFVARRMVSA